MTTAQQQAAEPDLAWLPPYGFMNQLFMNDLKTKPVPDGFEVDGHPGSAADWSFFVEQLVGEIADVLWPQYLQRQRRWDGKAAAQAEALTRADLTLMGRLKRCLSQQVTVRASGANALVQAYHRTLFVSEDDDPPGPPCPTIEPYLALLPPETTLAVRNTVDDVMTGFGPAPLRFKTFLQRPRAIQVAFILGFSDFSNEWAKSGVTPSMISGHCLQGMIGFCGAYMRHRDELQGYQGAVERLQQICVDYGDRRVFAGVHYPSDNVGSWYVALRLCSHLYGEDGQVAKDFMWSAISTGSAVFAAMKQAGSTAPEHAALLTWLEAEAKRPANPVPAAAVAQNEATESPAAGGSSGGPTIDYHRGRPKPRR